MGIRNLQCQLFAQYDLCLYRTNCWGNESSNDILEVTQLFFFSSGMAIGQFLVSFYINISYSVIIMYTIYYFFASFTSKLPWSGCHNSWNTAFCSDLFNECLEAGGVFLSNNTCVRLANLTTDDLDMYNITSTSDGYDLSNYTDPFRDDRQPASQEYFK